MKKRIVVLLFAACLLLAACQAEDPENLFETTQEETGSTTAPTGDALPAAMTGEYQYGNMQKYGSFSNFALYNENFLFITQNDSKRLLGMYDPISGEVSLLCKDAACTHSGVGEEEDCLSANVYTNLESYDGKFYKLDASLQIMELTDGIFQQIVDGKVDGFFHHNQNLYVKTKDKSLLVYENGSDTPRVLVEEFTLMWTTIFGQYLYGCNGFDMCRVDLQAETPVVETLVENAKGMTDGQHIYYVNLAEDNHLYRCDMDGANPTLLVDQPVLLASINFDNDYFYYRLYTSGDLDGGEDSHDLYRLSKSDPTQMEKIATLAEPVWQVYTAPGYDKIFVSVRTEDSESGEAVYIMGTDGSNPTLLEMPEF